jgi:hypothetical protein
MGAPVAAAASAADCAMDLLTFRSGGPGSASSALAAVDCSMLASQLGAPSLDAPGSSAPLVQQQRLAWTWASPLTGKGWARPAY